MDIATTQSGGESQGTILPVAARVPAAMSGVGASPALDGLQVVGTVLRRPIGDQGKRFEGRRHEQD